MLNRIDIENYRGIREGTVQGLARVNLFVGPNGSGKSNLLEAIFLAAHRRPAYIFKGSPRLGYRRNEDGFPTTDAIYGKSSDRQVTIDYDLGQPLRLTIEGRSVEFDRLPIPEGIAPYVTGLRLLDANVLLSKEVEHQRGMTYSHSVAIAHSSKLSTRCTT